MNSAILDAKDRIPLSFRPLAKEALKEALSQNSFSPVC